VFDLDLSFGELCLGTARDELMAEQAAVAERRVTRHHLDYSGSIVVYVYINILVIHRSLEVLCVDVRSVRYQAVRRVSTLIRQSLLRRSARNIIIVMIIC